MTTYINVVKARVLYETDILHFSFHFLNRPMDNSQHKVHSHIRPRFSLHIEEKKLNVDAFLNGQELCNF